MKYRRRDGNDSHKIKIKTGAKLSIRIIFLLRCQTFYRSHSVKMNTVGVSQAPPEELKETTKTTRNGGMIRGRRNVQTFIYDWAYIENIVLFSKQ